MLGVLHTPFPIAAQKTTSTEAYRKLSPDVFPQSEEQTFPPTEQVSNATIPSEVTNVTVTNVTVTNVTKNCSHVARCVARVFK